MMHAPGGWTPPRSTGCPILPAEWRASILGLRPRIAPKLCKETTFALSYPLSRQRELGIADTARKKGPPPPEPSTVRDLTPEARVRHHWLPKKWGVLP